MNETKNNFERKRKERIKNSNRVPTTNLKNENQFQFQMMCPIRFIFWLIVKLKHFYCCSVKNDLFFLVLQEVFTLSLTVCRWSREKNMMRKKKKVNYYSLYAVCSNLLLPALLDDRKKGKYNFTSFVGGCYYGKQGRNFKLFLNIPPRIYLIHMSLINNS